MKSIIVGTAGHIDHGKTTLVKALTGIDADRLAEEKRRGITIDLGFAHMEFPASNGEMLRLGFVDVPGHERFVRNMLAGVGGIDLVLLVIAADESIKPQTREHFDILQLLGVQRGITVLTKSDAVDPETLDVVRLEVEEFLRGTFLETPRSAIVPVSSLTDAGLDDLKLAMIAASLEVKLRDSMGLPRLPIDRVFSMKGFGTVVTGTLLSGTIRQDDELDVFPSGRRVRVRGVQVHGRNAASAVAGQRTALNLSGASTDDLDRGMTLASPATFTTTDRIDVNLRLLASAPRVLKNRARVRFHSNTMETTAEIVLHNSQQITKGSEVIARLKLLGRTLLLPGDRFIIRQISPVVTIGGGVVLDAMPITRKLNASVETEILGGNDRAAILTARIARRLRDGITIADLVSETGWGGNTIVVELTPAMRAGAVVRIGEVFLTESEWGALKKQILLVLGEFHRKNPLVRGVGREELRVRTSVRRDMVFESAVQELMREKKIEVVGDLVYLPGHGVVMKDEEAESKTKIELEFASAGLKVPALHEVIAGLKVDRVRAQKIVTLLLRDRVLVKISDELVFHRSALEQLRAMIAAHRKTSARIDVAKFKELTGVSRKYAIPLLEYLDRERITKRVGDVREIL